MNLIELKNEFYKKKINKANYIKKIYNRYHDLLFQYSDLISKTDVQKIEITSSSIKMTSKKFGVNMIVPKFFITYLIYADLITWKPIKPILNNLLNFLMFIFHHHYTTRNSSYGLPKFTLANVINLANNTA